MANSNFYYDRYSKLIENNIVSKSSAIEKLIRAKCSLVLGRNFGESVENFLSRDADASKRMKLYDEAIELLRSLKNK